MKNLIYIGLSVIAFSAIASISVADELEEVVVTSSIINATASEISNPIHVLDGGSISNDASQSIGSLIDGLVGVSSSDFGAAVGQPVIRGLSGTRVKLLNNGKVVRDISSLGPDHSNEIDLGHLQQIEIIRGPSSLLYANGAIGGIVNIVDNTIAKQDIESAKFNLGGGYEDGNSGNTGNVSFVGNVGGFNLTSSFQYSNLDSYAIPEHAVIHHDDHDDEGEEEHEEHGAKTLENSDFEKTGFKLGLSKVEDWGYIGVSYADSSSTYGIPFHGEHEDHCVETPTPEDCKTPQGEDHLVQVILEDDGHCTENPDDCINVGPNETYEVVKEAEERIFADTNSETINLEGSYNFGSGLVKRADYFLRSTSYDHTEQHAEVHDDHDHEDEHEPTVFKNDSDEYGLVLDVSSSAGVQKVSLNIAQEDVSIDGEEKFLDPTKSDEIRLGYFTSKELDIAHIDFGIRYDQIKRKSDAGNYDAELGSISVAASRELAGNLDVSLGISSVQKAPSASELFIAGDHMVIQRYELGDPNLDTEKSSNIDLSFETTLAGFDAKLNLFRNNIANYIYSADVEVDEDADLIMARLDALGKSYDETDLAGLTELEISAFKQQDAVLKGYELEISRSLALENGSLEVSFGRDYVDAQFNNNGGYIPRSVPTRNMLNFRYNGNSDLDWVLSIKDVQKQSKVASAEHHEDAGHEEHGETPTDGFLWVNFSLSQEIKTSESESVTVSFFAKNLLNKVARNHSSFVKGEVPLPGRNFGIKANYSF
jgi:iron complex outermembrane receptor protein